SCGRGDWFSLNLMPRIVGTTDLACVTRDTPGGVGGGNGDGSVARVCVCWSWLIVGSGPGLRSPIICGTPPDENPSRVPYVPGSAASVEEARSSANRLPSP